jgi:acyl-coenzyme A synthetase/AMP-(fatty) acid ligase
MLLDAIQAVVDRQPNAPAFIHDGRLISYGVFAQITHAIARHLHEQGIKTGDVVGLAMTQTPLHCCAILALARLGAASLPIDPSHGEATTALLCRRHDAKYIVSDIAGYTTQAAPRIQLGTLQLESQLGYAFVGFIPQHDTPFRLALTSGTSGTPKAVLHTHGSFVQRIAQTIYDCTGESRLLAPDLHITLSVVFALGVLMKGGVVVFPADYRVTTIAATIQSFAVTHLILIPSHAAAFANALPDGGPMFPSLRHVRIVGATPSPALIATLKGKCTDKLFSPYALTELGVITLASSDQLFSTPHTAGLVQPWATVEIQDEDGEPTPTGQTGLIRLKVDGMPSRYEGETKSTGAHFADGWFYPGDIGRFSADGQLFVEGRQDDLLNVAGNKVNPGRIEDTLNRYDGIHESAAFMWRQPMGETLLVAAIVGLDNASMPQLSEWAKSQLGLIAPDCYFSVSALPKSPTGKIKRKETAAEIISQLEKNSDLVYGLRHAAGAKP